MKVMHHDLQAVYEVRTLGVRKRASDGGGPVSAIFFNS